MCQNLTVHCLATRRCTVSVLALTISSRFYHKPHNITYYTRYHTNPIIFDLKRVSKLYILWKVESYFQYLSDAFFLNIYQCASGKEEQHGAPESLALVEVRCQNWQHNKHDFSKLKSHKLVSFNVLNFQKGARIIISHFWKTFWGENQILGKFIVMFYGIFWGCGCVSSFKV